MKLVYGATSPQGCGLLFGGGFELLGVQAVGVLALGCFFFVANVVVFWVLDKAIGIRVGVEAEVVGLDVAQHSESRTQKKIFSVDAVLCFFLPFSTKHD